MGRVESLTNWTYHKLDDVNLECENLYYYTRKMNSDKSYYAHVYIFVYNSTEKLCDNWKKANYYVAVKHQAKVELVIEKSNFYICFFTPEAIGLQIKNTIEEDSFCAKKYLFEGKYKSSEEYVKKIEKQIFHIDLPSSYNKIPKFESLELQNFRGYAGNVKLIFNDRNKKPASFVLLYAKNGVGKTSIFDAVEFALKGEVGRIQDLNKKEKEKMRGPIYHHREHEKEKAFVLIRLSDGREIRRKVANVAQDGNDCRVILANPGSEIVGTSKDKDIWNQIILPHDKIDNFISAKSPVDQFKEWTDSAVPLVNERKEFIESYSFVKKLKHELDSIEKKQQDLCEELEEVKGDKLSVQKVLELIKRYNTIPGQSRLLVFESEKAGAAEYDELINQVKIYRREISDNILSKLNERIQFGEEILETGFSFFQKQIDNIKQMEMAVQESEKKIIRRKELDKLLEKEQRKRNLCEKLRKELEPMVRLDSYGYNNVKKELESYQKLKNSCSILVDIISVFSQKRSSILEEYQHIQTKIKELRNNLLSNDKLGEIYQQAKKYDSKQNHLKELEIKIKKEEEVVNQLKKSLSSKRADLQRIEKVELSEHIEQSETSDVLKVGVLFNDSLQQEFENLIEEYNTQNLAAELYQKQVHRMEQNSKELEEICERGRRYLHLHKEVKSCPLCHTEFESWESLVSSIDDVNKENTDEIKKEIYSIRLRQKEISEKYNLFLQKYQKEKCRRVDDIKQDIEEVEEEVKHYLLNQRLDTEEKDKINQEIASLQIWFVQQGIKLESFSSLAIEQWEKSQKEKLSEYIEERNEIQREKDRIEKELDETRKSLKEVKQQKENIDKNEQLIINIRFLAAKKENFNFEQQLDELRTQYHKSLNEIEGVQAQISLYDDVADTEEKEYMKQKDIQLDLLKEQNSIKIKCSCFLDFTEQGVVRELKEWKDKREEYEKQIEYLVQIEEENSARNYFARYKKILEELNVKKEEFSNKREEVVSAEQVFDNKKTTLEKSLKEYFSLNVMNEVYGKIDPHDFMKNVEYHLSFNENDEPQLYIQVSEQEEGEEKDFYRPEWYFSTAQLNTVAFSSFFGRALSAQNLPFRTIFVDDPISHFDDMNILGFSDMIRSIVETIDCQIIMSTHDEKIFRILERKLDDQYYSSCFIRLPVCDAVEWNNA